MTGVPHAIASSTGMPNPSYSEGNRNAVAAAVERRLVLLADLAGEDHPVAHVELADQRARVGVERVAEQVQPPGDHELVLGAQRRGQRRVGADDPLHVLAQVEAAEVEDVLAGDVVPLADGRQQPGVA